MLRRVWRLSDVVSCRPRKECSMVLTRSRVRRSCSARRKRQDRVFVRGKIEQFFESKLTGVGSGCLFLGGRLAWSSTNSKTPSRDPNLSPGSIAARNGRSSDKGSVAASQILTVQSSQSDEETVRRETHCLPTADHCWPACRTIFAVWQRDHMAFKGPLPQQSSSTPVLDFSKFLLAPSPLIKASRQKSIDSYSDAPLLLPDPEVG